MDVEGRTPWLRDVLFNGATSNAFQLGTVLTRGWFWTRRAGCSAIYQGGSAADIDLANSICAVEADARIAAVPSSVRHKPGLSYCYVVRRFNACGSIERTESATVRLRLDSNGRRCLPVPNPICELSARVLSGNGVALSWLYSPLAQETPPAVFHVLWDGEPSPLAVVPYIGPKLYSCRTAPLPQGDYVFVIRSKSLAGAENPVAPAVTVQVRQAACQPIQIVGVL
jgi:hypothetical protein